MRASLFFLIFLAACSDEPTEITAPEIHYGQDMCAECSMIVSEERFAGAIGLRENGRIRYLMFDDIGEMLLFDPPESEELHWFVHDATTLEWLDAESAVYLRSEDLTTPMGTGVAAYAGQAGAAAALEEYGGGIMTFAALRAEAD